MPNEANSEQFPIPDLINMAIAQLVYKFGILGLTWWINRAGWKYNVFANECGPKSAILDVLNSDNFTWSFGKD